MYSDMLVFKIDFVEFNGPDTMGKIYLTIGTNFSSWA